MAGDEIRRVSVEHDDAGKPFYAPAQEDVAATPIDEIRDRELQALGVATNDLVAGWRKGWAAAVANIAPADPASGAVRGAIDTIERLTSEAGVTCTDAYRRELHGAIDTLAKWRGQPETVPVYGPAEGLMKALDILHGIDYAARPEAIEMQVGEAMSFLRAQYVPVPPEPGETADAVAKAYERGRVSMCEELLGQSEPPKEMTEEPRTEDQQKHWLHGYVKGTAYGERRTPNESKAFNEGYEKAAGIYRDRRARAIGLLELMPHTDVGQTVARVRDILNGHEDGPEITAPELVAAREERDRKAPPNPDLPDYSKPFTARRILHNILGVWENRSKSYIRGEVQDARDAIDAGRYTDYPEKVEKVATGCGQNNNYDEGYRRGMIDGEKSGRHAQQCEDNHRLGRWLRAEDDRRQREIGDRGLRKANEGVPAEEWTRAGIGSKWMPVPGGYTATVTTGDSPLPHSPVPSAEMRPPATPEEAYRLDEKREALRTLSAEADEYDRLREQGDRHSKAIDDAKAFHEGLDDKVDALQASTQAFKDRAGHDITQHADRLDQHDRRLANRADEHDHLVADLVAWRTEGRERFGKIERLLRILAPHEDRERTRLLELHPANRSEEEKVELNRLNAQVMTGPSGDPDSDRAGRIIREAAEGVENGLLKRLDEHDEKHEQTRKALVDVDQRLEARANGIEQLNNLFDQLRADHDSHVAEYASFAGRNQTLAQAAHNAARSASDGVNQLEKQVDEHGKAIAANKTHWENVANRVDRQKADVDRLRTEVGGASGRAETAVEVAREARRVASNPDGDAGVPQLGSEAVMDHINEQTRQRGGMPDAGPRGTCDEEGR